MTIDEAIQHCEEVADTPCFTDEEARCYSEHRQLAEWLKELKAYREQGGDAISRQAVLDILSDKPAFTDTISSRDSIFDVKHLPSVMPQQRTGHWIIIDDCEQFIAKCSECGRIEDSRMINNYPYCHCGAKMEV